MTFFTEIFQQKPNFPTKNRIQISIKFYQNFTKNVLKI